MTHTKHARLRRKIRFAATAAPVAVLIGCTQVPDYASPDLPVRAAWSSTGSSGKSEDIALWWRRFGSVELVRLEMAGIGRNFDLQAAISRIQQARGAAVVATAPLLPSLELDGVVDRSKDFSVKSTQNVLALASYEVDFWGKNRAAADSAATLADAVALDTDTVTITLTASIANAYFQILSLRERIERARQIARDADRILELVQLQRGGGTASDLQVEQQRNLAATFASTVPTLQLQLDQSEHLLSSLLGEPAGSLRISANSLRPIPVPTASAGLPSTLLARRPDIRAAEARLVAANFDIGVARAAFLPSLTLSGSVGLSALSASRTSPTTLLTDTAAGLVQPLFEGGRLRGQLQVSEARAAELVAIYRQTAVNSFRDVEDALSAEHRIAALAATSFIAVTSARRSQALAEQQYKLGGSDYLTVLNTQRTLFQAEDSYLQVRLQRLQAAVSLFRALGGGFDARPIRPAPGPKSAT